MRWMIARVLMNALGLWIADSVLDGVTIADTTALGVTAVVLGLINALLRPVIYLLTFPINFLTLGLFRLVINGGLVLLAARLVPEFQVAGFVPAVMTAVIVGLTNWFLGDAFEKDKKKSRDRDD